MNSSAQKIFLVFLFLWLLSGPTQGQNSYGIPEAIDTVHSGFSPQSYADSVELAMHFSDLGQEARQEGRLSESLHCYQKALHLLDEDQSELTADIRLEVGHIHAQFKNDSLALGYFTKAYKANEQLNRIDRLSETYEGVGDIYFRNAEYEQALHYYLKAQSYEHLQEDSLRAARLYTQIGAVFSKQQQYDRANSYLEKAGTLIPARREADAVRANRLVLLAEVLFVSGNRSEAIDTARRALDIAEQSGAKPAMLDATYFLQQAFRAVGRPTDALAYLDQAYVLRSELYMEEKELEVLRLEERFQSQQKEQQIMLLQRDREIKQMAITEQRNTLIYAMAICLVLLLLLLTVWRAYHNKQRTSRRLAEQHRQIERQTAQLQQALREKEVLMYELHHRTKNNLNYLTSLMSWQSRQMEDSKATQIINESRSRLHAISLIHQHLYQSQREDVLSLRPYLQDLIHHLQAIFDGENRVRIQAELADLQMDIHRTVPLGLIVNEAFTNAYKHAFLQSGGTIEVILKQEEEAYQLTIRDDGQGMQDATPTAPRLITGLVRQMGGSIEVCSKQGLELDIRIPIGSLAQKA